MNPEALAPLPVVVPLAVAAVLLAFSKVLPSRAPDLLAVLTALVACGLCAALAVGTRDGPVIYWFGGWHLIGRQVVGISFVVDMASAGIGALVGLLFAATLVFAWGFFAKVNAHFHVLMLIFMAGMIGFCLTGDLFNMFVWFELMSVAGFAATGFSLRPSSIAGALNFTVVNTIGAYVFLAGIGLLYAQLGVLDFVALGQGVAATPGDPVLAFAFVLVATALLTKAAQFPFHLWLADAHGVAPSPVSVIFSGAMVAMGLLGLAKIAVRVFGAEPAIGAVAHEALLAIGLASALVGGLMALAQRHIKRLLAFSTIAHAGIMLTGLSLLSQGGLAGLLAYMTGHGLVKGAMFMIAGFVAAKCGGIDEVQLRGRGRRYWPVGLMMGVGGVLLAGLPFGPMDEGFALIARAAEEAGRGWIGTVLLISAAMTGAGVLRIAGRVFVGWGEQPGHEQHGESEQEVEIEGRRPAWLMALPALVLLLLGVVGWDSAGELAEHAAAAFGLRPFDPAAPLAPEAGPWIATAAALVIAAFDLSRRHLPKRLTGAVEAVRAPPTRLLQAMQSGLVTDYVAWLAAGVALLSLAFVFGA